MVDKSPYGFYRLFDFAAFGFVCRDSEPLRVFQQLKLIKVAALVLSERAKGQQRTLGTQRLRLLFG